MALGGALGPGHQERSVCAPGPASAAPARTPGSANLLQCWKQFVPEAGGAIGQWRPQAPVPSGGAGVWDPGVKASSCSVTAAATRGGRLERAAPVPSAPGRTPTPERGRHQGPRLATQHPGPRLPPRWPGWGHSHQLPLCCLGARRRTWGAGGGGGSWGEGRARSSPTPSHVRPGQVLAQSWKLVGDQMRQRTRAQS